VHCQSKKNAIGLRRDTADLFEVPLLIDLAGLISMSLVESEMHSSLKAWRQIRW